MWCAEICSFHENVNGAFMIFRGFSKEEHDTEGICLNLVGLEDRGALQFSSTVSNAQCMSRGYVNSSGLMCFMLICRNLFFWGGLVECGWVY